MLLFMAIRVSHMHLIIQLHVYQVILFLFICLFSESIIILLYNFYHSHFLFLCYDRFNNNRQPYHDINSKWVGGGF